MEWTDVASAAPATRLGTRHRREGHGWRLGFERDGEAAARATDALPANAKGFAEATISFTFPLADAPNVEGIQAGGAASEHCPGTIEGPSAAAGYLCPDTTASSAPVTTYNPATEALGAAKNGAIAFTELECAATPCNAHLVGTWAVTAS